MTGYPRTALGQHLMILQLSAHPGSTLMSQLSGPRLSQISKQTPAMTTAKQREAGLPLQQTRLPSHVLALPLATTLLPFLRMHVKGRVVISLAPIHKHLLPIPGQHLAIQILVRVRLLRHTTVELSLPSNRAQCLMAANPRFMLNLEKATFGGHTHWTW